MRKPRSLANLPSLRAAQIVTAAYCGQFNFPLTVGENWRRLLTLSQLHPSSLTAALTGASSLVQQFPAEQDWWQQRQKAVAIASQKWQQVASAVSLLQMIPWIDGVFVTGSLAMNSVTPNDDIDFLIVTQPQRLWLTRLWVG